MGLVRAAYSAGKPAYGVGPGQRPRVHRDVGRRAQGGRATSSPARRSTTACCARRRTRSSWIDADRRPRRGASSPRRARYFLSPAEVDAVARVLVTPQRLPNPALVGKSAVAHRRARPASACPPDTRVLIAPLAGVGRDYPLSIEKLCPVLSFYVVSDWREGCERCKQILRYGGMGHTMSIHSAERAGHPRVRAERSRPSASSSTRPTTHGSIGLTTGLDPAMTLGCGGYGGNITSDNISPRHLLNIKRLAYEVVPALAAGSARPLGTPAPVPALQAPQASAGAGVRPAGPAHQGIPGLARNPPGRDRRAGNGPVPCPRARAGGRARTRAACRVRVRGRRPPGNPGRPDDLRRRALDRHARRPGPG